MNVRSLFPSNFVAAEDLQGRDVTVQIARIVKEKVGRDQEERPVLYFAGMARGMVLNKTNAKRIASLYGGETEAWLGQSITLYPSETEFGDETVPCVRVRNERPQAALPAMNHVVQPPAPTAVNPAVNLGGVKF